MTPRLPVLSGSDLIGALEKIGYRVVRQRGSHVRLRDNTNPRHRPVTVPLHKELKRGLLRSILRDANLSSENLMDLL
ncbi:MAG: type II toxin-antitoxin system HicA family toxin [Terriglobia bacterium]